MIEITTKTNESGSYQVEIDEGSMPVSCVLTGHPTGVTINAQTRRITWSTGIAVGRYEFIVRCSNCAGTSEPVQIVMNVQPVTTPVNCESATPPGSVRQVLVEPVNAVRVPDNYVGLHVNKAIPNWYGGGGTLPDPLFPFKALRSLAATGRPTGSSDAVEECGFWSLIEDNSGNYDWRAFDDWQNNVVKGKPYVHVIMAPPARYAKYPNEPSRWPSHANTASAVTDEGLPALTAFVQAIRNRYPNVMAFEIWNEPAFRWDTPIDDYTENARLTPEWIIDHYPNKDGCANCPDPDDPACVCDDPDPVNYCEKCRKSAFFNGSPTDLANIGAAIKSGAGSIPVWACGWENSEAILVTRSLKAKVTIGPYAGRELGEVADAISGHFYNFGSDIVADMVASLGQYRSNAGVYSSKPFHLTEGGRDEAKGPSQADVLMEIWYLIPAILGFKSAFGYGHMWGAPPTAIFGAPNAPEVIQRMNRVNKLNGATICNAAILQDGSIWAVQSDGVEWHLRQ